VAHTPGDFFYDPRTESIGSEAGWIARVEHTQKGDGEFGNPDDDGYLFAAAPDLLAALEIVEWVNAPDALGQLFCPWCGNYHRDGHRDDCARQAALARARGEQP